MLAAGQTVSQLDRGGALTAAAKRGGSAAVGEQLAAAVQQACASASCVLVPAGLVASGQLSLAAFQQVAVYASEPASQMELKPHLSQLACPLHFLEVPLPSLASGAAGPQQAAAAPVAAAPQRAQQRGPAGPAMQAGPPGVARVQHAARTAAPAAVQPGAAVASKDWPLIISSDPCRPIRWAAIQGMLPACVLGLIALGTRTLGSAAATPYIMLPCHPSKPDSPPPSGPLRSCRPLYEAVLALEQQGAAVVERPLSLVDLVLSPSAALVVCDNSAAKLVRRQAGTRCIGASGLEASPLDTLLCFALIILAPIIQLVDFLGAALLQEFDAFLSALAPVLSRLSFAFASVVLVCEGSPGFQAQVGWVLRGGLGQVLSVNAAGSHQLPSACRRDVFLC